MNPHSKACKIIQQITQNAPKLVQKNAPGASRPQGGSKLPSESNGMHPGAQNPYKHIKNPENTAKSRESPPPPQPPIQL